ncbi:MAG: hypothetical protein US40_C0011G0054 [Candidatus Roizmanbacteria bacterium GW2011_GWC2_37_13]|uniref:Uncharacterized protein n=1 Tax=Candidatus Roizmanbacteria bacterium GW2011_GWC2_37_13 TaxID=1618486 RepID=A0A0G0ILT7_9BACT|nr:MAG: hypothetical protein US38_C0007G0054 [Candidatus Roizmanbacteria bacterium GW2011_GWC1_37_12]KKQ25169.1 MAG: hypothetical protein US40_C0011G0054 [Candidatus Roizmanbacteria bacterium GW2011_GWC2_37_13]
MLVIPLQLGYLYLSKEQGNIAGITTIETKSVLNSASIGEFHFSLFGYTSPLAEVSFNGQGISDQTTADTTGYFEFNNRFSPYSPREACLSSKDQFGRISSPVCLAPFPTQYDVTIGPVIIPPTISLDKPDYFTGDEVILTGQTIPGSEINLSMFTSQDSGRAPSGLARMTSFWGGVKRRLQNLLIKPVEAFSIPQLTAKSDSKGNFSISLPSSSAQNYRLFTQVDYQDESSPNSLALSLKILPVWMIIIKFFGFIWSLLKSRLLEVVILLEIVALLAHLIRIFLHPYYLSHNKAIILYENRLPVLEESHPLVKT